MIFDFDANVSRENTNSVKWDVAGEGVIPLWVADMDFTAAPPIREALEKRVAHGIFGYSRIPDEWADAYRFWWRSRHGFEMDAEDLIFCSGVVPAVSSLVRKFTTPGEKIVIISPVYNVFYNSIINNGARILESPLKREGFNFEIDFEDLEQKLADPLTTMLIFCNPHNPVGKIWDRATMARLGELCKKHHVLIISDEIHCDITAPGRSYIPFGSVSETCLENSITCIAPTKAFNIAGLNTSAVYVKNEALRNRAVRALNTDEIAEPNAFAVDAAIAAFTKGGEWLDALREYVEENKKFAVEFIKNEIPVLSTYKSEATYLLWIDCSKTGIGGSELSRFLREKGKVFLSDGSIYGRGGENFLRMNVATQKARLEMGLERIRAALKKI